MKLNFFCMVKFEVAFYDVWVKFEVAWRLQIWSLVGTLVSRVLVSGDLDEYIVERGEF